MAKNWHKVVVDGVARYRASASKQYVSYNVEKDSWSSKMIAGNIPVEQLAKAPKVIRVKGMAWGEEVVRSYMEGECPLTHTYAVRGKMAYFSWDIYTAKTGQTTTSGDTWKNPEYQVAADPKHVHVSHYAFVEKARARNVDYVAELKAKIAAAGGVCASGHTDAMIVELA